MGFGEDLKDQLSVIDNYTQAGTSFLHDVRDFMKERAAIEKDYAHKLDQLARKYQAKRTRHADSLPEALVNNSGNVGNAANTSGAPLATAAGSDGNPKMRSTEALGQAEEASTMHRAWAALLAEVEKSAKARFTLSEQLQSSIADTIKSLAQRKEDSRKKHIVFAGKLVDERNKIYNEKDKMKAKYDESCDAVDAAKQKFERAPDEKTQDRFKKVRQQEIMSMHDAKNNYLISIQVANSIKKKFYYKDMVAVQDQLQEMNESRISLLRLIWETYLSCLLETDGAASTFRNETLATVQAVNGHADCETFVKMAKRPWTEPYEFAFVPCLLWKDSDQLVTDDAARIYLANKIEKARAELAEQNKLIDGKRKEMDGLANLLDAYTKNPTLGDAEEVREQYIESQRHIMLQENQKAKCETHIAYLTTVIGSDQRGQTHQWSKASFTIPTTCDFCQSSIWGLAKQGLTCKECGYNCHLKCELKIPANCTQEKGGGKSQRGHTMSGNLNIADPYAQTRPVISGPSSASSNQQAGSRDLATNQGASALASPTSPTLGSALVLYDYAPQNSEELAISDGETLKILSGDDGSGWIMAQGKNGKGLVPATYIQVKQALASPGGASSRPPSQSNVSSIVTVLYAYDAAGADELTIKPGDKVEVLSRGEGWWEGKLNGKIGQFPASYGTLY